MIGVAWWSADGAREAFGNSVTTTVGRSALRLRLYVAAANVVGSNIVLLGWRGEGRLDRSRGSLGGSDASDVGGGRFAKQSGTGKARHHDTGDLVLLVVGDDFALLLLQYDLDILVGCLANMLDASGGSA